MERTHAFILILTEKQSSQKCNSSAQLPPSLQVVPQIIQLRVGKSRNRTHRNFSLLNRLRSPSITVLCHTFKKRQSSQCCTILLRNVDFTWGESMCAVLYRLKTFPITESMGMQCKTSFRLPYRNSSFPLNLSQTELLHFCVDQHADTHLFDHSLSTDNFRDGA